ncbi:hypothetical protein S40285_08485 [Stachybotrys chlorohalonatus IBT 40285]|uniref:MOZ protein represents a chromatin-associated acetyltransferase n=1 Tax=Stachybotrys chlorohalonatus (strain IBT 40285) TaxID=1283841 RepID=A0A084QLM5_STAC4|nr:hypothetical protein S40285_08485 [Stachybotrys chlorohalonata IBT 40285]
MTAGRLVWLYPIVLRATAVRSSTPGRRILVQARTAGGGRTWLRRGIASRHGKAVEPPRRTGERGSQPPEQHEQLKPAEVTAEVEGGLSSMAAMADKSSVKGATETTEPEDNAEDSSDPPGQSSDAAATDTSKGSNDAALQRAQTGKETTKPSGSLETILAMGPPEATAQEHLLLAPPPYMHHFDTYSLVKHLQQGGFSQESSVTAMKGIRSILAHHLDKAQAGLVSKSDVENETYLFRAACAELAAEIKNNRRLEDEQMRQQRTHLQHEVDILTQSLNQELLTLNDNVRGMFNDRKMAVREEQKAVDSAVQQINYKISIMLSSDSKSEIEGLRWILIRRSVLGIIFMAVLTLGTLRYASYVSHERAREQERRKREQEELRRDGGRRDRSSAADAAAILAAS